MYLIQQFRERTQLNETIKKQPLTSPFAAVGSDAALPYLQYRWKVRLSDTYILQRMKDPLGDIKILDVFLGRLITEAFVLLRMNDFYCNIFPFVPLLFWKTDDMHFSRDDSDNIKIKREDSVPGGA